MTVAIAALPLAQAASAYTGGVAPSAPSNGGQGPQTQPGNTIVTAQGNGMSISSRASALLRGRLHVSGSTSSSQAGQTVEIERLGRETHGRWAVTATAPVQSDGTFRAVWNVNHIGRFQLRAIVTSASASHAAAASPTVTITSYRPSLATIYGPGFWGHSTACGQTLTRHTVGVANRTLPCGTPVALYYNGRTLVVPVIDRGPYANGADWDLTAATAKKLGVTGTNTIAAVSLPPAN
jgi:rare lipoprotein A (peptidoglycan hydrolase)